MNLFHRFCLSWVIGCAILGGFDSLGLQAYLLHQVGTVIMILILLYYHHKIGINNMGFGLYCLGFLSLHIFAAHYLYSYVPYNDWLIAYLNIDLHQTLGWQRNMFDRLIHFCYGLLLYPFFYQVGRYYFKPLSINKIHIIVLLWVMASSMIYELIEWGIALTLSPETAESYNGQQGDIWDAHKDMFWRPWGVWLQ